MNPIHCVLVDDEPAARRKLQRLLEADARIEVVAVAEDGVQAVQQIQAHQPELVFLDIQMPSLTGFDVLRLLPERCNPLIVFVTAYDEYALKAFEVSAVDYLLKPYSAERLQQSIDRAESLLGRAESLDSRAVLSNLREPGYAQQIAAHSNKRIRLVNVGDIRYIVSEHRLVTIYTLDGERFWTNETLQQLQQRLDPQQFFRIHRSSLINLTAKFDIEPWEDGRLRLHYPDESTLTVAREPAKELRHRLGF